jgi:hypothetical protein
LVSKGHSDCELAHGLDADQHGKPLKFRWQPGHVVVLFHSCGSRGRAAVARPSCLLRQLEYGVQALPRLAQGRLRFIRLFAACSAEPDMEYAMVDATIVKIHRHGQGQRGDCSAGHL